MFLITDHTPLTDKATLHEVTTLTRKLTHLGRQQIL